MQEAEVVNGFPWSVPVHVVFEGGGSCTPVLRSVFCLPTVKVFPRGYLGVLSTGDPFGSFCPSLTVNVSNECLIRIFGSTSHGEGLARGFQGALYLGFSRGCLLGVSLRSSLFTMLFAILHTCTPCALVPCPTWFESLVTPSAPLPLDPPMQCVHIPPWPPTQLWLVRCCTHPSESLPNPSFCFSPSPCLPLTPPPPPPPLPPPHPPASSATVPTGASPWPTPTPRSSAPSRTTAACGCATTSRCHSAASARLQLTRPQTCRSRTRTQGGWPGRAGSEGRAWLRRWQGWERTGGGRGGGVRRLMAGQWAAVPLPAAAQTGGALCLCHRCRCTNCRGRLVNAPKPVLQSIEAGKGW